MIITNNGPQSIGQIRTHFQAGTLFLSPEEYQRENAWNLSQKKLLIDTVFRNMDIPKFYLWKIDQATLQNNYPDGDIKEIYRGILANKVRNGNPNPFVYEVVDGQQRIRTFLEFMRIPPPI